MPKNVFFIHDVEGLTIPSVCGEEHVVFDAGRKSAFCKGCFDCWLKTPGKCSINDNVCGLADNLAECDTLVIISRVLYGGFSTEVKRAVDRLIAFNLPFFKKINGELHHKPRFVNNFDLKVIFYGDCTDEEKSTAEEYVLNIALNFNGIESTTCFVDSADLIGGAL